MSFDGLDQAFQLGRMWDGEVSSSQPGDADLLADIAYVERIMAVPPQPATTRDAIWRQIHGKPLVDKAHGYTNLARANGMALPKDLAALPPTIPRRKTMEWMNVWMLAAIGAAAGFSGGVAGGIWVRAAMRLSGFLTTNRNRGLLTDNDEVVGRISLDGTMFLVLTAAFSGIVFGILYMAVRPWLPRQRLLRAVSFGMLMLGVFGFILMDEHNPDYQLFGPVWINVVVFSLTYIVFGMTTSFIAEGLDRWVHSRRTRGRSGMTWVSRIALAPFAALGLGAVLAVAIAGVFDATSAIVIGLLLCLWLQQRRDGLVWLDTLRSSSIGRLSGFAVFIPALFGVYLTVHGVYSILAG